MHADVDFDRQGIERKDFPIARRGYDPAAVDAHLKALASEVDELQRRVASGGEASLASAAGNQVQTILEAAEAAAGEIERAAHDGARQVRDAANRDAEKTREDALEKARAHVASVAQVSASLLERVGSMDAEVNALVASLRAGAGRLAADLSAVEAGMGELYGAASGAAQGAGAHDEDEPAPPAPAPAKSAPAAKAKTAEPASKFEAELDSAVAAPADEVEVVEEVYVEETSTPVSSDVDGARLIALNMALNGESRSDTERYLAENFSIPDRLKLIDEVYAAIEG
jgi:DivIVA domain-containing protein